jgi:hypothetical protein
MNPEYSGALLDDLKAQGKLTGPFIDGLRSLLIISPPTRCVCQIDDPSSPIFEKILWMVGIGVQNNGNTPNNMYEYSTHWASDQFGGTYHLLPEDTRFRITLGE